MKETLKKIFFEEKGQKDRSLSLEEQKGRRRKGRKEKEGGKKKIILPSGVRTGG